MGVQQDVISAAQPVGGKPLLNSLCSGNAVIAPALRLVLREWLRAVCLPSLWRQCATSVRFQFGSSSANQRSLTRPETRAFAYRHLGYLEAMNSLAVRRSTASQKLQLLVVGIKSAGGVGDSLQQPSLLGIQCVRFQS